MALCVVTGNLLEAREAYIGHQCNCITKGRGAGLARLLFEQFPYADTYKNRTTPTEPGTYSIHGDGQGRRFVVNLYSQYHPGKAKPKPDSRPQRLEWLIRGLEMFVDDHGPKELALPYGIGCGLAGGNWQEYHDALTAFAAEHALPIVLYKL